MNDWFRKTTKVYVCLYQLMDLSILIYISIIMRYRTIRLHGCEKCLHEVASHLTKVGLGLQTPVGVIAHHQVFKYINCVNDQLCKHMAKY